MECRGTHSHPNNAELLDEKRKKFQVGISQLEGEKDEASKERRIKNEIIEEVNAGIQKKAIDEGVENKE